MPSFFLSKEFPELANELKYLLCEQPEYGEQVDGLLLIDRCRCEDESCSTMYTLSKPNGSWGIGHQSLRLNTDDIIIIDSVNGVIADIEILDRGKIRERLLQLLP